jgi:hypothetical protein
MAAASIDSLRIAARLRLSGLSAVIVFNASPISRSMRSRVAPRIPLQLLAVFNLENRQRDGVALYCPSGQ